MKLKSGVNFELKTEILKSLSIIEKVYNMYDKECVITSAKDGKHMENSLHYVGQAIDIRINFFTKAELKEVHYLLKLKLGKNYDVVLESNHFHIEYDVN